jgi:hypothetical protein
MFYYCVLLTVGNDICPTSNGEMIFCSTIIFLGAFLEAYIIGGMTAEFIKVEDHKVESARGLEYICFSMDIHNFPD